MKLHSLLYLLPLFASSLADKPDLTKRDAITAPYYLKTKTINGGDNTKDGLYVGAYHTGAGLNEAVLGSKENAIPGYLNNTYQVFNLSDLYPWTFSLGSNTNYAGWQFVFINGGYGTTDLFLNDTGLQWTSTESFGGWLACDWWHGMAQLFWKVSYDNYPVSSCAQVQLVTEAIAA